MNVQKMQKEKQKESEPAKEGAEKISSTQQLFWAAEKQLKTKASKKNNILNENNLPFWYECVFVCKCMIELGDFS